MYITDQYTSHITCVFSGPDSDNVQHVYQLSLQGFNMDLTESRVSLHDNFVPYISVVACIGEDEYLYVFNANGESYRLDLTLNALEHIEKPKGPITTLKTVLVVKSCLFMIADESLWVLDQTDLECMWAPAVENNFPKGHYTVLGDCIYILDLDNENAKKYTAMTSQLDEIKDFACKDLQASVSLVGFGHRLKSNTPPTRHTTCSC